MKKEVCLKFRLPKDAWELSIYEQAEDMRSALVEIHHFLYSGNNDITLENIRGFFDDHTQGLIL